VLGVGGRRAEASANEDGEEQGEEEEHDQVAFAGATAAPAAARHPWCLTCVWTAWLLWLCVCV
jgi:hypothetical protein